MSRKTNLFYVVGDEEYSRSFTYNGYPDTENDLRWAAEDAAKDYFYNTEYCAGEWPITVTLYPEGGLEPLGRFNVHLQDCPEFSAEREDTKPPKRETPGPTCPTCRNFTLIGEFSPCNTCTDRNKWIENESPLKRTCHSCAHRHVYYGHEPCRFCDEHENWQPKGEPKP